MANAIKVVILALCVFAPLLIFGVSRKWFRLQGLDCQFAFCFKPFGIKLREINLRDDLLNLINSASTDVAIFQTLSCTEIQIRFPLDIVILDPVVRLHGLPPESWNLDAMLLLHRKIRIDDIAKIQQFQTKSMAGNFMIFCILHVFDKLLSKCRLYVQDLTISYCPMYNDMVTDLSLTISIEKLLVEGDTTIKTLLHTQFKCNISNLTLYASSYRDKQRRLADKLILRPLSLSSRFSLPLIRNLIIPRCPVKWISPDDKNPPNDIDTEKHIMIDVDISNELIVDVSQRDLTVMTSFISTAVFFKKWLDDIKIQLDLSLVQSEKSMSSSYLTAYCAIYSKCLRSFSVIRRLLEKLYGNHADFDADAIMKNMESKMSTSSLLYARFLVHEWWKVSGSGLQPPLVDNEENTNYQIVKYFHVSLASMEPVHYIAINIRCKSLQLQLGQLLDDPIVVSIQGIKVYVCEPILSPTDDLDLWRRVDVSVLRLRIALGNAMSGDNSTYNSSLLLDRAIIRPCNENRDNLNSCSSNSETLSWFELPEQSLTTPMISMTLFQQVNTDEIRLSAVCDGLVIFPEARPCVTLVSFLLKTLASSFALVSRFSNACTLSATPVVTEFTLQDADMCFVQSIRKRLSILGGIPLSLHITASNICVCIVEGSNIFTASLHSSVSNAELTDKNSSFVEVSHAVLFKMNGSADIESSNFEERAALATEDLTLSRSVVLLTCSKDSNFGGIVLAEWVSHAFLDPLSAFIKYSSRLEKLIESEASINAALTANVEGSVNQKSSTQAQLKTSDVDASIDASLEVTEDEDGNESEKQEDAGDYKIDMTVSGFVDSVRLKLEDLEGRVLLGWLRRTIVDTLSASNLFFLANYSASYMKYIQSKQNEMAHITEQKVSKNNKLSVNMSKKELFGRFLSFSDVSAAITSLLRPLGLTQSEIDNCIDGFMFMLVSFDGILQHQGDQDVVSDNWMNTRISVAQLKSLSSELCPVLHADSALGDFNRGSVSLRGVEYSGSEFTDSSAFKAIAGISSRPTSSVWCEIEKEVGISRSTIYKTQPRVLQSLLVKVCRNWRLAQLAWEKVVRKAYVDDAMKSFPWILNETDKLTACVHEHTVLRALVNILDNERGFLDGISDAIVSDVNNPVESGSIESSLTESTRLLSQSKLRAISILFVGNIDIACSSVSINLLDQLLGSNTPRLRVFLSSIGMNGSFCLANASSLLEAISGEGNHILLKLRNTLCVDFFNSMTESFEPLLEPWKASLAVLKQKDSSPSIKLSGDMLLLNLTARFSQSVMLMAMHWKPFVSRPEMLLRSSSARAATGSSFLRLNNASPADYRVAAIVNAPDLYVVNETGLPICFNIGFEFFRSKKIIQYRQNVQKKRRLSFVHKASSSFAEEVEEKVSEVTIFPVTLVSSDCRQPIWLTDDWESSEGKSKFVKRSYPLFSCACIVPDLSHAYCFVTPSTALHLLSSTPSSAIRNNLPHPRVLPPPFEATCQRLYESTIDHLSSLSSATEDKKCQVVENLLTQERWDPFSKNSTDINLFPQGMGAVVVELKASAIERKSDRDILPSSQMSLIVVRTNVIFRNKSSGIVQFRFSDYRSQEWLTPSIILHKLDDFSVPLWILNKRYISVHMEDDRNNLSISEKLEVLLINCQKNRISRIGNSFFRGFFSQILTGSKSAFDYLLDLHSGMRIVNVLPYKLQLLVSSGSKNSKRIKLTISPGMDALVENFDAEDCLVQFKARLVCDPSSIHSMVNAACKIDRKNDDCWSNSLSISVNEAANGVKSINVKLPIVPLASNKLLLGEAVDISCEIRNGMNDFSSSQGDNSPYSNLPTLTFYSALWLQNDTGLFLEYRSRNLIGKPICFASDASRCTCSIFSAKKIAGPILFPQETTELSIKSRPNDYNSSAIADSLSSLNCVSVALSSLSESEWSDRILLSAINSSGEIKTSDIWIGYCINGATGSFHRTKVVTLSVRYVVVNSCNTPITLSPVLIPDKLSASLSKILSPTSVTSEDLVQRHHSSTTDTIRNVRQILPSEQLERHDKKIPELDNEDEKDLERNLTERETLFVSADRPQKKTSKPALSGFSKLTSLLKLSRAKKASRIETNTLAEVPEVGSAAEITKESEEASSRQTEEELDDADYSLEFDDIFPESTENPVVLSSELPSEVGSDLLNTEVFDVGISCPFKWFDKSAARLEPLPSEMSLHKETETSDPISDLENASDSSMPKGLSHTSSSMRSMNVNALESTLILNPNESCVLYAFPLPSSLPYLANFNRSVLGNALRATKPGIALILGSSDRKCLNTLKVVVHSAVDLMAADFMGKSDPYVVIRFMGEEVGRSSTKRQTLEPVWDEEFDIPVCLESLSTLAIVLQVYDNDFIGDKNNDFLGEVKLDCTELKRLLLSPTKSAEFDSRLSQNQTLSKDYVGGTLKFSLSFVHRRRSRWTSPLRIDQSGNDSVSALAIDGFLVPITCRTFCKGSTMISVLTDGRTPSSPRPSFRVENRTVDLIVWFRQSGSSYKDFPRKSVRCEEWMNFAWDDCNLEKSIDVTIADMFGNEAAAQKIQIENVGYSTKIPCTGLRCRRDFLNCFVTIDSLTRVVHFSNIDQTSFLDSAGLTNITLKQSVFDITLNGIGVTVIDSYPKEILFACLEGIRIHSSSGSEMLYLTISHIQVDNMSQNAKFPVILAPVDSGLNSANKSKSLSFSIGKSRLRRNNEALLDQIDETSKEDSEGVLLVPVFQIAVDINLLQVFKNITVINYVELLLQPIHVNAELDFLVALLQIFLDLRSVYSIKQARAFAAADVLNDLSSAFNLLSNPIRSLSGKENSAMMCYCRILHLHSMKISVHVSVGRSDSIDIATFRNRWVHDVLQVLASLAGAVSNISPTFYFNDLVMSNAFDTIVSIATNLFLYYAGVGAIQVLKVLGTTDILGDPIGLIAGIGTGVVTFFSKTGSELIGNSPLRGEGIRVLVQSVVGGTFGSAAKITGSVGDLLLGVTGVHFDIHLHSKTAPVHLGHGLVQSIQILGSGIAQGVSGLVLRPMQGAEAEGVLGAAKGTALGVVEFVVLPLAGIVGAAARIAESVQATTNLLDNGVTICSRRRAPRSLEHVPFLLPLNHSVVCKGCSMKVRYLVITVEDRILSGKGVDIVKLLEKKRFGVRLSFGQYNSKTAVIEVNKSSQLSEFGHCVLASNQVAICFSSATEFFNFTVPCKENAPILPIPPLKIKVMASKGLLSQEQIVGRRYTHPMDICIALGCENPLTYRSLIHNFPSIAYGCNVSLTSLANASADVSLSKRERCKFDMASMAFFDVVPESAEATSIVLDNVLESRTIDISHTVDSPRSKALRSPHPLLRSYSVVSSTSIAQSRPLSAKQRIQSLDPSVEEAQDEEGFANIPSDISFRIYFEGSYVNGTESFVSSKCLDVEEVEVK